MLDMLQPEWHGPMTAPGLPHTAAPAARCLHSLAEIILAAATCLAPTTKKVSALEQVVLEFWNTEAACDYLLPIRGTAVKVRAPTLIPFGPVY